MISTLQHTVYKCYNFSNFSTSISYSTMCILKSTLTLYVLTFGLLYTFFGADPIFQICQTSDNFTTNNPYDSNLNKLTGDLAYKTPPKGFNFSSMGVKHNKTYGLALCRGDVSEIDCAACIIEASSNIRKNCPNNKGAITWYDKLTIKLWFMLGTLKNVSDLNSFNPKVRDLLTKLAHQDSESPKMYKTGVLKLVESRNLYGLVQCTGDLSGNDCTKCLDGAIKQQPDCCDGKQGGRVITGSCNMRYDLYQFFKDWNWKIISWVQIPSIYYI